MLPVITVKAYGSFEWVCRSYLFKGEKVLARSLLPCRKCYFPYTLNIFLKSILLTSWCLKEFLVVLCLPVGQKSLNCVWVGTFGVLVCGGQQKSGYLWRTVQQQGMNVNVEENKALAILLMVLSAPDRLDSKRLRSGDRSRWVLMETQIWDKEGPAVA